ncbi:hypothetical protein KJ590_00905, partial [Patescibacteria group bacterium]|nr:hypothetical protein [Patescibacteria group bacterium]
NELNRLSDDQRGATAILLAFFVMNILLMMALTTAGIMIYQIQMSKEIANSVLAFYAADAGVEQCLYQVRRGAPGVGCANVGGSVLVNLGNGASGQATLSSSNKINAFGVFGGTRRSVELTWE